LLLLFYAFDAVAAAEEDVENEAETEPRIALISGVFHLCVLKWGDPAPSA